MEEKVVIAQDGKDPDGVMVATWGYHQNKNFLDTDIDFGVPINLCSTARNGEGLWIAYSLATLFTAIIIVIGSVAMCSNEVTYYANNSIVVYDTRALFGAGSSDSSCRIALACEICRKRKHVRSSGTAPKLWRLSCGTFSSGTISLATRWPFTGEELRVVFKNTARLDIVTLHCIARYHPNLDG